jgi:hypothetical protein
MLEHQVAQVLSPQHYRRFSHQMQQTHLVNLPKIIVNLHLTPSRNRKMICKKQKPFTKSLKGIFIVNYDNNRSLARGTALKREADKLSRSDPITAAVIATRAVLYFISAFACDDQGRKLRGKLALHENWKSTSEFIVWVINHQKDKNEPELEGLWYRLTTSILI